jgi:hypothetical protein
VTVYGCARAYFIVAIYGRNPNDNADYTDDIQYSVFFNETSLPTYIEDAANDHEFHTFKMVYNSITNLVDFYKDGNYVVTLQAGPRPYDELPLLISGRDYSDTNYLDWIRVLPLQKPEHDLAVTLNAPTFLKLGESALLNATVWNRGLNNETNVEFSLFINGTIASSILIPELLTEESYTFSYSWTPTVEGLYNVSVYTPPIPGEEITTNNLATKNVKVMTVKVYQLSHTPRRMHGDENYIYYTAENGGTYRINKVTGVEEFFSQYGHDLIWVEGNYVYVGEGYELSGSYTNDIYKYDKNGKLIWHVHPTYEGPWGGATFQFGVGKYYIYAVAGPYAYGAISKEDGSIV